MDKQKELLVHEVIGSSTIKTIRYNEETQELDVLFNTDKWYRYSDIRKSIFDEFCKAESAGTFLAFNIKGVYGFKKL